MQGHTLLAGDFNARVGNLLDPWVADVGHGVPPQLLNTENTINAHGRKLMRVYEDSSMILCTGRTVGDTAARPSFKARANTVASRLDHVLVDPDLFPSIQSCRIGATRDDSDHMPLELRISLGAAAPPLPSHQPHMCHTPTWIWDGAKREQSAHALQAGPCQAILQQGTAAVAAGDLHQSDLHFNTAVTSAAQMTGLRQTRLPGSHPPCLSDFPWFDSRCAVLRPQLRRAHLLSPRSPEVKVLQRRYRGQLRRSKAAGNSWDVIFLSQLMKTEPRQFWRKTKMPHTVLPPELCTLAALPNWRPLQHRLPVSFLCHTLPSCLCLPVPSISPCQRQRLRLASKSCIMAGLAPCWATPQSCCAMLSWRPQTQTRLLSTSCCLACKRSSIQRSPPGPYFHGHAHL